MLAIKAGLIIASKVMARTELSYINSTKFIVPN